jgi:hypothetical protein
VNGCTLTIFHCGNMARLAAVVVVNISRLSKQEGTLVVAQDIVIDDSHCLVVSQTDIRQRVHAMPYLRQRNLPTPMLCVRLVQVVQRMPVQDISTQHLHNIEIPPIPRSFHASLSVLADLIMTDIFLKHNPRNSTGDLASP